MAKLDKEYINLKISNCQRLVDEADNDSLKEAYQYFLDFWTNKLPESQRPETIVKKEEEAEKILEENAEIARLEMIKLESEAEDAERKKAEVEAKQKRVAELKAQLKQLEPEPEPEELNEINFEKEFPNKKAYRSQNGERIETIAYKEYLNKSE